MCHSAILEFQKILKPFLNVKIAAVCHIAFLKIKNFNFTLGLQSQYASPCPCHISSQAVKRLQQYGDLTVVQMMTFISTNCYVFVHYGSGIFNSTEID